MTGQKTLYRFYTIADFIDEAQWLREEHQHGWKLIKMIPPCIYRFERCVPEDVIYQLEYKSQPVDQEYMSMYADFGWEYVGNCFSWHYFRKDAKLLESENDGKLFSENASKIEMLQQIFKTRLCPLALIFLCCVIPNIFRIGQFPFSLFMTIFWICMFLVYTYLLLHCGIKLRKLKKELEEG